MRATLATLSMDRYICIHAHFYQPPRENPWLETIEAQPSAHPYHDWNERVTAECYAPNGAARIVDEAGRIQQIVNNYSKISFNFGPTLLSWLEAKSPDVYQTILEADQQSQRNFSGHGSAIAQAYNHMILPLAHSRDKQTQIIWGIHDFERRFGRMPEGMWLAETAVDTESLEIMAAEGLKFTILSPFQAARTRRAGAKWREVSGGKVDPTRPYNCILPSGNSIALFFYDGPISQAVAFEKLLNSGPQFAERLVSGFSDERDWPQIMHIATDGESYGHHHPHGDMALAYALKHIEQNGLAKLTNYGEYLEKHPPELEAQILEQSSWSCCHGVQRWHADCGCRSGGNGWNQKWRGPLRAALDWLRDAVSPLYEQAAGELVKDPWQARDQYIDVVLDRSAENVSAFFLQQSGREISADDRIRALKLLELQRHAMLMYTSCGWFFDELSGIETIKVIEYAGRVIQLAQDLFGEEAAFLEPEFLDRLALAKSNVKEHGEGARLFRKWVKPAVIGLKEVAAHYAISSMFERNPEDVPIYCYEVERRDFHTVESGKARMGVGRAMVCSKITNECVDVVFGVLHLGDHNISAGVRDFQSERAYRAFVHEVTAAFKCADLPQAIRALDRHFGGTTYSLQSLFADERSKIMDILLGSTLREAEATYRAIYDHHAPLLRFLTARRLEKPRILALTSEFVINAGLKREFSRQELDVDRIDLLVDQAMEEEIRIDREELGYRLKRTLNILMERLMSEPDQMDMLKKIGQVVGAASTLGVIVNLWRVQNLYFEIARSVLPGMRALGNDKADQWCTEFLKLGKKINIDTAQFIARPRDLIAMAG